MVVCRGAGYGDFAVCARGPVSGGPEGRLGVGPVKIEGNNSPAKRATLTLAVTVLFAGAKRGGL